MTTIKVVPPPILIEIMKSLQVLQTKATVALGAHGTAFTSVL